MSSNINPLFNIENNFKELYKTIYEKSLQNKKTSKTYNKQIQDNEIRLINKFNSKSSSDKLSIINDIITHYTNYASKIINFDEKLFKAYITKFDILNHIKKPTTQQIKDKNECNFIIVELFKVNLATAVSLENNDDLYAEFENLLKVPILLNWIRDGIFPFRGPDKKFAVALSSILYYYLVYIKKDSVQNAKVIQFLISHTSSISKTKISLVKKYNKYLEQIKKVEPIFSQEPIKMDDATIKQILKELDES